MSDINPSTGLPTVGGVGSPDICGNTYGGYEFDRSSVQISHHQDNSYLNSDLDNTQLSLHRDNKETRRVDMSEDRLNIYGVCFLIIYFGVLAGWLILLK